MHIHTRFGEVKNPRLKGGDKKLFSKDIYEYIHLTWYI